VAPRPPAPPHGQRVGRDRLALGPDRVLVVVTGEGVSLDLELAGLGSRGLGALVDLLIAVAILALAVAGGLIGSPLSGPGGARPLTGVGWLDESARVGARLAVPALVLAVLVPLVGELALRGRSPGKRVLGLAVVDLQGGPADLLALVTRNLLRPLDIIPGSYGLGALVMLASSRAQRWGDLAAGTVVVRRRRGPGATPGGRPAALAWQSMGPPTPAGQASAVARVDTRGWGLRRLGADHREVLQAFAARRYGMPPAVRASLAMRLAEVLRRVVDGVQPDLADEVFLDALLLRLTTSARPPVRR